jgi:poly(3-hydroxybutyrate) depolymerase
MGARGGAEMISCRRAGAAILGVCGVLGGVQILAGKRMSGKETQKAAERSGASAKEAGLSYGGRGLYVHVPERMAAEGQRALVVVLHGGMGNAERIAKMDSERGMNLDAAAEKYGFIVAYLNGTAVTRMLGEDKKGWNAGLCCGKSAADDVDDVKYISGAVKFLVEKYGVDEKRVYGVGHSNGAMMTQRMICETNVFAAGVSISGTLEIETEKCAGAAGKKILEIHGEKDSNVPIAGGVGKGISRSYFKSQGYAKKVFESSGATYTLEVLPEAEHQLDTIEAAIKKQQGMTLPEKIVKFLGLGR